MKTLFTLLISLVFFYSHAQMPGNYALDFDGRDDCVELPNFPNQTTNFSISAWIQPNETGRGDERIFADDRSEGGQGYAFALGAEAGPGLLRFFCRTTNPVALDAPVSAKLVNDTWYFVTCVADISNHSRYIYINGELVASDSFTGTWSANSGDASIGGVSISSPTGVEPHSFYGQIDDLVYWNKALTKAEVNHAMCFPTQPTQANITGLWRFNEGSGTSTADESGHGYNGTLHSYSNPPLPEWKVSTAPQSCPFETPPNVTINDPVVTEGNTGTINAAFVVSLDKKYSMPVSVKYVTANDNTNGEDYVSVSGTLTIPPNTLQQTVNVPIKGDLTDEYNESFRLKLSYPVNAKIAKAQGTCLIVDNDIPPGVSVMDTSAPENAGHAIIRVSLSRPSAKTATVKFNTGNQTALARYDYASRYGGSLVFSPGETTKYIDVTLFTDELDEVTETFKCVLYDPENARPDPQSGGRTIAVISILNSPAWSGSPLSLQPDRGPDAPLMVHALPNPSSSQFELSIHGGSQHPILLRVTEINGRLVEVRTGIYGNSLLRMGASWKAGVYIAEIIQDEQKRTLRLIKKD